MTAPAKECSMLQPLPPEKGSLSSLPMAWEFKILYNWRGNCNLASTRPI